MKKLLKPISLAILFQFFVLFATAQFTCLFSDTAQYNLPDDAQELYASKNGWVLPANGTLRILFVFVEIDYDTGTDPNPNGTDEWPIHSIPVWAGNLLDPQVPTGQPNGLLTQYYQEASFGNYNLIGDYLVAPDNGGVFKILKSQASSQGHENAAINKINQQLNGNVVTANGLNNINYFDNWSKTTSGKPKITPSIDSPNKWDHIMFIWRNRLDDKGHPYNGTGNANPGSIITPLLGYYSDSYSNFGTFKSIPLAIARHEYAHLLYGGNDFHSAGGGWGSPTSNPYDYWIPQTGGWSVLGLSGSSLQTWNAWDRQRMGWKAPGNSYNPSARNAANTAEANGDLDATNANDAGIYTLRDFITSGDAIRIKLPFTDPEDEFPEFLWIENHTGTENNGSPFDHWQYEEATCVEPFIAGMLTYIQIDRAITESSSYSEVYSGYANYIRPLTADGRFDRSFESVSTFNDCVQWGDTWAFIEGLPNPLTGGCEEEHYTVDVDNNDVIGQSDQRLNFTKKINGTYYKHLYELGNTSHVFTLEGNKKIGISSNPSSASSMNLISGKTPNNQEKNLHKVYLNGVSVEIIACDANKNLQVQIRFDDVDVDSDVRWCADEIVLSPVTTASGYSLNLKSGKKILLDQGTTATRMDNPITFNGQSVFVSPTLFRCTANTVFNMETNSTLELDNASTLQLEPGSSLDVNNGAKIDLKNNSDLIVQNNATLTFKAGSSLYLSGTSELVVEEGGTLVFESGVNVYGNSTDKITVNGNIQVGTQVTFQKNGSSGYFYGLVLNNSTMQTSLNEVTFNEAQLHNYGAELNITNCSFISCPVVYSHYGDVTVTNSSFQDTWLYIENTTANQSLVATVDNCTFTGNQNNGLAAIDIWNYSNFVIEDNTINGYYNGVQVWQSGGGTSAYSNRNIYNNEIYNCLTTGITVYSSTVSLALNYLHGNTYGIRLLNNSNTSLNGNSGATSYNQTNYITNNTSYELYASTGSFPWYFRYNVIIDEDNLGNPSDPMVYSQPPSGGGLSLKDVRYNCWGNNFSPSADLYPVGYMVDPIYCPSGGDHKSTEIALEGFQQGLDNFENGQYADAREAFENIINQYPKTQYAEASMKELFALEKFMDNDYNTLKQYYNTNDSIQADTALTKLAVFLSNKCEVELQNWQTAINHYESIIENPESPEDSIFAIIDLGYTYLLMGDSGYKSSAQGRLQEYIPASTEEFSKNRDYLISLLPFGKSSQNIEDPVAANGQGKLLQNTPNPFTNTTSIQFTLGSKEYTNVEIRVYDQVGKEVKRTPINSAKEGANMVELNMQGLPAGIYYYSLIINQKQADTKKMVVVR